MQTITLAYCIDNVAIADQLDEYLKLAGYRAQHEYNTSDRKAPSLSERLTDRSEPMVLLISDNYLKSPQCMEGALGLLQRKGDQILPVIVEGKGKGDSNEAVPTRFERVSDIIQYINYWQEQYLDLRRQKRQLADLDEASLEAHLRVVRSISGEIGEFLRLLRQMDFVAWEDFQANHFERLFTFLQDEAAWNKLKAGSASIPASGSSAELPTEQQAAEEGTEASEQEAEKEPLEQFEGKNNLKRIIEKPWERVKGRPDPEEVKQRDAIAKEEKPTEETASGQEERSNGLSEFEGPHEQESPPPREGSDDEQYPPQVDETLEEVRELLEGNRPDEALELLEEKRQIFPDHPEILFQTAILQMRHRKDVAAARATLDQLLNEDAGHLDALFLRGELAEHQEDYTQALADYERVLHYSKNYPNLYYRLGILLSNHFSEQKRLAAKYLKRAIKRDKTNADARYQYAMLQAEVLDNPKKAIKYFEKTLDLEPDHPFAQYDLALLHHKLGNRKEAWQAYRNAIAINPELQTPENDEAFSFEGREEVKDELVEEEAPDTGLGQDTIEALRNNLVKLEKLLAQQGRLEDRKAARRPRNERQTVLVTGATSGIGKETADLFAREGYRVILCARRREKLEALQKHFAKQYNNQNTYLLPLDVRNLAELKDLLQDMPEDWRAIDILVNNAGKALGMHPVFTGNLEDWDEMIDTNIKGVLYLTRLVAPLMVRRRKGHIINVGSTAGKEVYPNGNVYCATKFAVDALTKGMRLDLHPFGIRVSQVSPGHVEETEFAKVRFHGDEEKAKIYEDFQPLKALDVARAIYFIANSPKRVTIHDIVFTGTQQANSFIIDRSGRERFEEEE